MITIDWENRIIFVPRTSMQLVQSTPIEVRQLSINDFRLELKDLEDDLEGITYLTTHSHNPPVTVGGVTLARVVEIINNYTVTFEDGQYAVNLIGANSNIADVVNINQVSVRSQNSAGLTFSEEINSQSYTNGLIYIDVADGLAGSDFPRGTPKSPVNNYDDALLINLREKLNSFYLDDTMVFSPTQNIDDWSIIGKNPAKSIVVIQGSNTTFTNLSSLTVTGAINGRIFAEQCIIADLANFSGGIVRGVLAGTISLDATYTETINILQSGSGIAGTSTPRVDVNGTAAPLSIRDYSGGLELTNITGGNNVSVDILSGKVFIGSTSTNGTLVVRGGGRLVDIDTGLDVPTGNYNGLNVINETEFSWTTTEKNNALNALTSIVDIVTLLQKYEENRYVIDKTNNTLTVYDDDNITPILQFSLLDSTATPSTDEVAERLPL